MNIIYNTQEKITSEIKKLLLLIIPNIRKTQLNIIPFVIFGIIISESIVSIDIAKTLIDDFSLIKLDSVVKRIRKFFNNKLFKPYEFYDNIIRYVITNYKLKHNDKRINIIFDHMFSHDNYTVFMISMRIGKIGIPLWFRCFKGKDSEDAFSEELLKEGISYVSSLFDSSFDLIFSGDRWFNSISLLSFIESFGHTYVVRLKRNIKVECDNKRVKKSIKTVGDLPSFQYHSSFYFNSKITDHKFNTTIVISKRDDVEEPWIIATNGDYRRAIKDYGYRFGGIESIFKNQKSNGFYIKSINNSSLISFTNMYTLVCFTTLFLTIVGADYTINSKCYKDTGFNTHKTYKDKGKVRIMSLFNVGLTLFKYAFNSLRYIRFPISLILYDI